jgi:hypothetical protein
VPQNLARIDNLGRGIPVKKGNVDQVKGDDRKHRNAHGNPVPFNVHVR